MSCPFLHGMQHECRWYCYDNAVADSFFATLKKELVLGCAFETRSEADDAISHYA